MKTLTKIVTILALVTTAFTPSLFAQLTIPSDGSDGALIVTSNTLIDLRLAVTGTWSANNAANAGKGIYDPNMWAVVFKYSSVVISNGATVTFTNHPSRAPVVWLVNGNVTINGTVSLDGQNSQLAPSLAESGPGGFRGGSGFFTTGVGAGAGFGPGGASFQSNIGYSGSYGSIGTTGSPSYGNPSLLPLIGGSGAGGDGDNNSGGGGGGGAILIACSGNLSIQGVVRADGGDLGANSGGGSGGGIRLVCQSLSGSGVVQAIGGVGWGGGGGVGRIRIERVSNTSTLQVTPDPSVVTLPAVDTPLIWLPANGPTAKIISIGAVAAPGDPRASFGAFGPDIALPQVASTTVVVETTNAEDASTVKVRVSPRSNGTFTETTATLSQIVSTSPLVIRWTANVPVNNGYSAVQVRVVRP